MNFICNRSLLLREIAIAQEIITSKNAISILSNIYLSAENDTLTIKATDTKVNFETKIPVTVTEEGSTTVFGDKFLGILNSIPEGDLEFSQEEAKITIKPSLKKIRFQLKSIASDKYPPFPVSSAPFFDVPVKDLKEMILHTIFAISDDETRYFMNGVFFEKENDKLVMVATDGRRLAHSSKDIGGVIDDFAGIIVPPKILNTVVKRAGNEGAVSVSVTDKTLFIRYGSYNLSSVLIEAQFPNYRRVIPESQNNIIMVNRLEILEAIKRVSLMVELKSHRVYFDVNPGVMSIYSDENDIGEAKEEIPCKYEGEKVSLSFNYRYVEDPLKVMDDEEISIRFGELIKAVTIMPVPEKDFFHVIMPMQKD
jgi:DNA polymerase-3 subunit beta